jgi:hypothetical protein
MTAGRRRVVSTSRDWGSRVYWALRLGADCLLCALLAVPSVDRSPLERDEQDECGAAARTSRRSLRSGGAVLLRRLILGTIRHSGRELR